MADMRDFYYRQKVLEDELDGAFNGLEVADQKLDGDLGFCRDDSQPGVYGGIAWGFDATHLGGLDIAIGSGAAYRSDGKRVGTGTSYTVNTTYIGSCPIGAGGHGDGTTVLGTVGDIGKECIVSIFIAFDRLLSDERYDGYNQKVYFKRDESFHFLLTMGPHKLISDPGDPVPPARDANAHLIVDVRLQNSAGTVTFYSLSQARQEWQINDSKVGSRYTNTITAGRTRDAFDQLLAYYNAHVNGTADRHPAGDTDFTPTELWADGTGGVFGSSVLVSTALNAILTDLKSEIEVAGVKRIGAKTQAGSLTTPSQAYPLSLSAGVLESQLAAIMAAVNGRVFRGGDNGIAGDLSPDVSGRSLGASGHSWDAYLRDLRVSGALRSSLLPDTDIAYNLGGAGGRFANVYGQHGYFDDIDLLDTLETQLDAGVRATVLAQDGQGWGVAADHTTGRSRAAEDGTWRFSAGILFQPDFVSVPPSVSPYIFFDYRKCRDPIAQGVNYLALAGPSEQYGDIGYDLACGVRVRGHHFCDDFSDIRPDVDLLPTPATFRYHASGLSLGRTIYAGTNDCLRLTPANMLNAEAHIAGPGCYANNSAGLLLHCKVRLSSISDLRLFVGLIDSSTSEGSLPLFLLGGQDLIGIWWDQAADPYPRLLCSNTSAYETQEIHVGMLDDDWRSFYLYIGATTIYCYSNGWTTWTPVIVPLPSPPMVGRLYLWCQRVSAPGATFSVDIARWGAEQFSPEV